MAEELLDELEQDINDVRERSKKYAESWDDKMTSIENSFEQYNNVLFADDATQLYVMGQKLLEALTKKTSKASKDIIGQHKELHAPVSRIGKTVDRGMTKRISELMKQEKDLETDPKNQRLTERMIADYFVSAGLSSVAEELDKEASLNGVANCRQFAEDKVKEIYTAMENKEAQPALAWLDENCPEETALRCDLLKQIIIEHLRQGDKTTARAKMKELATFGFERQMKEVARALSLGPNNALCKSLFSQEVWPTLLARLSQVIYQADSSLDDLLATGGNACVKMLNIKKQMRKDHIFTSDELPIQIPPKKTVHNTFTCPILRQQTTESNPPMRLLCGHVISKDALTKLSQSTRNFRVKCPYCPSEGASHDAKMVHF